MSAPLIFEYLNAMNKYRASDMYLTVGVPPCLRAEDELIKISDKSLTPEDAQEILSSILTARQKRDFEMHMELNTALDMGPQGRFRINVLRQRQNPALVIRRIVSKIPSFDDLMLPPVLQSLSMEKRGLILVTGMTGSGKSTTLAAMIDQRNTNSSGHIITIEDPIEFFHEHKGNVVSQREVGTDTESYAVALKNALRQRPDLILVGEIRDREVMENALSSAETGHLCLATIHSNNSYQAIERITNLFPEDYHSQVRLNLSMNLKAIISQRLLPSLKGGMVPAVEVLINQGLCRELILRGEISKIHEVMEQNAAVGMTTFDQSLMRLYLEGHISDEMAVAHSDKSSDMKVKIQNAKLQQTSKAAGGSGNVLSVVDTSRISLTE